MTREEFRSKWQAEADSMRRRGVMVNGALLCDEILRDIELVFGAERDGLLTLREASARSEYSEEHLGKLIRQGALPNAGRKGSPRIRAGDLPRRPASRQKPAGGYDPAADAARLASRLHK